MYDIIGRRSDIDIEKKDWYNDTSQENIDTNRISTPEYYLFWEII